MGKKIQKVLIPIALAILVVALQVLNVRIGFFYKPLLKDLEFGLKTGGILIAMEGLSLLSGIALAWLPVKRPQIEETRRGVNPGFVLLLVFTLLLVIAKVLLMGFGVLWSVDILLTILPTHSALGEWVYLTPVSSLLAGFSLGRLLRR
jgi:hypothetical protein